MFKHLTVSNVMDLLPQLTAALTVTLVSISDGMHYGWTSPMLPVLRSEATPVKITKIDETWLESSWVLAGLASLPITAYLVAKIGRKNSILMACVLNILSWICITCASRVEVLYCGRILAGAAADVCHVATPMYLAEISDKRNRGFITGLNWNMMYFGQFLIYVLGSFCSYYVSAIFAIVLLTFDLVLIHFMPMSPYFLIQNGKFQEAKVELKKLRTKESNVEEEFEEIAAAFHRQNEEKGKLSDLFSKESNRKAFLIITILTGLQIFSGSSSIVMNFHSILGETHGFSEDSKFIGIIFVSLSLIATLLCCAFIDRFGRKFFLILSGFLTGVSLLALSVYYNLKACGFQTDAIKWIPLISVTCYGFVYRIGLGFLPQMLLSELFSDSIKAYGMTWGDAVFIISNSVSLIFYQYFGNLYGSHVPLYVFSGAAFLSVVFTVFCVPETTGKSLDEIQLSLEGTNE